MENKRYTCELCNTTFRIGICLIDDRLMVVSPCDCYHHMNDEADRVMEEHDLKLKEEKGEDTIDFDLILRNIVRDNL